MRTRNRWVALGFAAALALSSCAGEDPVSSEAPPPASDEPSVTEPSPTEPSPTEPQSAEREGCAHVIDVSIRETAGTFAFDVTVSSTETGWDKYADAWEVRSTKGSVLGVRELLHPHENEQPFTRSLRDVEIPESVTEVTVAARDSVLGFCGDTVTVRLPGRT